MKIIMHFNNTATTRTSCNLCRFFSYLFPCSNFLLNNFFQFFVLIFSPKIIYMQIFKTEFYNSEVNSQYVSQVIVWWLQVCLRVILVVQFFCGICNKNTNFLYVLVKVFKCICYSWVLVSPSVLCVYLRYFFL